MKAIGQGIGCLLAVVALVVVSLAGVYFTTFNDHVVTCTVTGRDRGIAQSQEGGSRSSMRVYTDQCDVLQVQDKLLRGKFRSATTYGQIKPGRTYEFTVVGFRFINVFPTILEAKEVPQ